MAPCRLVNPPPHIASCNRKHGCAGASLIPQPQIRKQGAKASVLWERIIRQFEVSTEHADGTHRGARRSREPGDFVVFASVDGISRETTFIPGLLAVLSSTGIARSRRERDGLQERRTSPRVLRWLRRRRFVAVVVRGSGDGVGRSTLDGMRIGVIDRTARRAEHARGASGRSAASPFWSSTLPE